MKFDVAEWDKIAEQRLGLKGDAAKARFLGVDPSNYSRITRGETDPSATFIARVMSATRKIPGVTFELLFPIVSTDRAEVRS